MYPIALASATAGGLVDPLENGPSASTSKRSRRATAARRKAGKSDGVLVGVGLFTLAMFAISAALVVVRWPITEPAEVTGADLRASPGLPPALEDLDPDEPMASEPLSKLPFGGQSISWWETRLDALGSDPEAVELYQLSKGRIEAMGFVIDGAPADHRVRPTRRLYKQVADRSAR